MTRILITRPLPIDVLERAHHLFDVEEREETTPMGAGQMRGALAIYDGIVPTLGDRFDADVFAGMEGTRCKILANFGVGYDHIDVAAAQAAGVMVSNTPGAVTDATADIAMALILNTARRLSEGEALLRAGRWQGWHPTQLLGLHVSGKRIGIVGMGRIGQAIAQRAHYGFGMSVSYYARSAKELNFDARFEPDLLELAAQCDVLVVALARTAETYHMIGPSVFEAMQDHAILVNIARGDIVDETALITALEHGMIAGAGLDVYEHEPKVPQALIDAPNTTLLPHLGTACTEVRSAMGHMALDNLEAFFNGTAPPHALWGDGL